MQNDIVQCIVRTGAETFGEDQNCFYCHDKMTQLAVRIEFTRGLFDVHWNFGLFQTFLSILALRPQRYMHISISLNQ